VDRIFRGEKPNDLPVQQPMALVARQTVDSDSPNAASKGAACKTLLPTTRLLYKAASERHESRMFLCQSFDKARLQQR